MTEDKETRMDDLDRELNTAMEDGLSARLKSLRVSSPHQQLEEFMASSKRMLEIQRSNILKAESEYQLARVRLLDDYRVRLENIKYECSVEIRALDEKHAADVADSRKLLERLVTMRDMPL